MSEVLEHLEDIDRMSLRRAVEATRDAQLCLNELTHAGFFNKVGTSQAGESGTRSATFTQADDESLEDEWRNAYENRKTVWKLEASQSESDCVVNTTSITNAADIERMAVDIPLVNNLFVDASVGTGDVVDNVGQTWTLNHEQWCAFEIIARHTLQDRPDQLFMYLGGAGGMGKSRVVNALCDLFAVQKKECRFRLAAFTGVATRNIGGATLHALLQLNDTGCNRSAKTLRDLAAMWEGVEYLFIDEVSILGCEMLHNVSQALTQAKGNTKPFGGVNVILAGDFAQLPPIGDAQLYKEIVTTSLVAAATNRAQGKTLGKLLWLSFETVIILEETMQQMGVENKQFVELLH